MHIVFDNMEPQERVYAESFLKDHRLTFLDAAIGAETAIPGDTDVLCVFVCSRVVRAHMEQAPNMKLIVTRSMGFDHIDLAAAKERGIAVARVPAYGVHTVAEFAFALLLSLSRNILPAYQALKTERRVDAIATEGFDLHGKTLGIIGTGKIGKNMAKIGKAFSMHILLNDAMRDEAFAQEIGASYVELPALMSQSDVISIHVPLLPATTHLINAEMLAQCKPSAILINTARGAVVDTIALRDALASGKLAAAGLDVFEGEKELFGAEVGTQATSPEAEAAAALLSMPNVLMTPHIAYDTREAKREILDTSLSAIVSFISGQPKNLIS